MWAHNVLSGRRVPRVLYRVQEIEYRACLLGNAELLISWFIERNFFMGDSMKFALMTLSLMFFASASFKFNAYVLVLNSIFDRDATGLL